MQKETYKKLTSFNNQTKYKKRRQELRNNSTEPENRLWQKIRNRQLGVKFRRQQGIGHYIADFYSAECNLIIELDGDSHFISGAQEYDLIRDRYMQSVNLKVLRFTNDQVMNDLTTVVEVIRNYINSMTPP